MRVSFWVAVENGATSIQAAKSFNTSFGAYRVEGKTLRANASPLSVPSSLRQVQAVVGLDDSAELLHPNANPPAGFRNARPCSAYWAEKTVQNTQARLFAKLGVRNRSGALATAHALGLLGAPEPPGTPAL